MDANLTRHLARLTALGALCYFAGRFFGLGEWLLIVAMAVYIVHAIIVRQRLQDWLNAGANGSLQADGDWQSLGDRVK